MEIEEEIPELVKDYEQELKQESTNNFNVKIPVTIITGFLGAGKSTLINSLLSDSTHGKKVAVILNELGETSGIDKAMRKKKPDNDDDHQVLEEWLELKNGCLCCSLKDPGVKAIEDLIKKGGRKFDYVLVETTGMADPGVIASMFWLDTELECSLYLDGIITLVDSLHAMKHLTEPTNGTINEFTRQIALADRIILNKCDLVKETDSLVESIKAINSEAIILKTSHSKVPVNFYLDLECFTSIIPASFASPSVIHPDSTVSTVAFSSKNPVSRTKLDTWLQKLLWEEDNVNQLSSLYHGTKTGNMGVLRLKAMINEMGKEAKLIVQGVYEIFDFHDQGDVWREDEVRESRMVVIGRGLDREVLEKSFEYCLEG